MREDHKIPEISIIFFGIIKDSITLNERFAPKSDEELKSSQMFILIMNT